jgi:hypothetical protein
MRLNFVSIFQICFFAVTLGVAVYFFCNMKRKKTLNKMDILREINNYMRDVEDTKFYANSGETYTEDKETYENIKPKKKVVYKREEECRRIFEKLFGKPFKKVRPKWLLNEATGCNLELDGFCPDIITPIGRGLAFEHDGGQHKKFTPYFHNDTKDFIYQTKKDELKYWKCKEKKIMLINIADTVCFEDLEQHIIWQLKNVGIRIPNIH